MRSLETDLRLSKEALLASVKRVSFSIKSLEEFKDAVRVLNDSEFVIQSYEEYRTHNSISETSLESIVLFVNDNGYSETSLEEVGQSINNNGCSELSSEEVTVSTFDNFKDVILKLVDHIFVEELAKEFKEIKYTSLEHIFNSK